MTSAEAQGRFVVTGDGRRVQVEVFGAPSDRTPVLVIPGLTRSNAELSAVALDLCDDRQVATLSLRGRGRSDRDPTGETYALDQYVEDVLVVLDDLGWDRAVFVGTSLGGLISLWT